MNPYDDFLLLILSSPSGAGKTTLTRLLLDRCPDLRFSVSHTTRPPRANEVDGRDYHFVDRAQFLELVSGGAFLEWAEVHGNLYGTPAAPVRESLASGECVILEIDVQGGMQVVERYPATVLVFVTTPDFRVLEDRLRGRQTEDEATIRRRLENARREVAMGERYHHRITNEDLDRAVDDLASLLHRLGCGGT
jgi:guanylate kinase